MRMRSVLLICFFACLGSFACNVSWSFAKVEGSGIRAEEARQIQSFRSISLRVPATVVVEVGAPVSLTISGDDNLVPLIETTVQGDKLTIESEEGLDSRVGIKVRITTPLLEGFSISGSGDVDVRGIDGASFDASISGSGDFKAQGQVDRLRASISGSGDMKLGQLVSRESNASISGSGDMELNVTETLEYSVSGSGDIRYRGKGRADGRISGSGSVRHEGGDH